MGLRDAFRVLMGNKSVGSALMSAMHLSPSPRPDVTNMKNFMERYADQAWVYICVSIINSKIAGVPLKIYKRTGEKVEELPTHPLKLLLDAPNRFMSGTDLLESTSGFLELVGTSYWLFDEFVGGLPTAIYPLDPPKVRVRADAKKFITGWIYEPSPGVNPTPLDFSEVIQFKTWNPLDPYYGQAPLAAGRDAADFMRTGDLYNKAFFENSAEPSGILSSKEPIDDSLYTRIKESWKQMHQGERKAHKIAILDGGLTWQDVTKSHRDMQFIEGKKMSRQDMIGVYRIPPVIVGVYDEVNYSTADIQRRIFWQDNIIPRMKKIEAVINAGLVKPYDPSVFAAFDLANVPELQEDKKQKAEEDEILTRSGIKKINEVRTDRKLPNVPWGDTWNAPIGLMAIDDRPETEPLPEMNPDGTPKPKPAPGDEEPEEDDEDKALKKSVLRREATWQAFKASTESRERKWAGAMAGLFNAQEREVKRNLRAHWEKKSVQARLDGTGGKTKQAIDVILFDKSEARKLFRKDARKLMIFTMAQAAAEQAERYGLGKFDLTNPRVARWLDEKAFKFADDVNTVTEEALRQQLEEAVQLGESLVTTAKRIEEVFDAARGYRAERIARTEVVSASNKGAYELYLQAGVQKTEWITARDSVVRESHQIDGQVRNIGSKFENGLEFPGDPSGEAEEVINCRCTTAPVVEEKS